MSETGIALCVVASIATISGGIFASFRAWDVASDCDWSVDVWRAKKKRDKARQEKMVYYLGLGFNITQARERAVADLNKEANESAAEVGGAP